MTPTTAAQLMIFFWKIGLVDTLTLVQYCLNAGAQYGTIVIGAAGGNFSDIGLKVLLAPISGLATGFTYVMDAKGAERRARIATLGAYLSASAAAVTRGNPASNGGIAAGIIPEIDRMRAALDARGGSGFVISKTYELIPSLRRYIISIDTLVNPLERSYLLNPTRDGVQQVGERISNNIFTEHTQRRINQGLAKKVLCSISAERAVRILPQINVLGLIGYSSLGIGLGALGVYFGLNLLREAENKHSKMMVEANQIVIDVKAIDV